MMLCKEHIRRHGLHGLIKRSIRSQYGIGVRLGGGCAHRDEQNGQAQKSQAIHTVSARERCHRKALWCRKKRMLAHFEPNPATSNASCNNTETNMRQMGAGRARIL